ncbi:Putative uncharacterized protein [Leuconostoc citreum]|nr:Protein of unknown function [Leuconostoc citreum LBAE E16]CDX64162.1 Putative uncharacterized protein [Leuconostoc citreum]
MTWRMDVLHHQRQHKKNYGSKKDDS